MRITLLRLIAVLTSLATTALAVPVAVNDSYSTNEDAALAISASFLSDSFGANLSGWAYVPNIFPNTNTGGANAGAWSGTAGNPPGGLTMSRNFSSNSGVIRSGGFQKNFTLTQAQPVKVTFDWKSTATGINAGATCQLQARVGTTGATTVLGTVTGPAASPWQTVTFTTASLAAAAHTLQIGVVVTGGTTFIPAVVEFDNVKVEATGGANGVLSNDTGGPISASLVTDVSNGTLTLNANGTFVYTPTGNFNGTDSFTYTCTDGATTSNVGTVTITVNPVNDAPVGNTESYSTNRNVTLNVPLATGVLANDTDIDAGTTLTAVLNSNAANGVVTLNANGSFTYVPTAGYAGADSFSYFPNDGAVNGNLVTVNLTVIGITPPVGNADAYTLIRNTTLNVTAITPSSVVEDTIPYGAPAWKYLDNGSNQGTAWRAVGFDDSTWASGAAELGYGDGDEATVVSFGPNPLTKYPTTYFRKTFTVSDIHRVSNVEISLIYDDGGVVYINGTRVLATPLVVVDPAFDSLAPVNSEELTATANLSVPASMLVEGTNTIAVEIHQDQITSSDITMNLRLRLTKTIYGGVLGNDTDQENDPLTAALVTNVTNGSLTLNANGTFTYTPTVGFTGTDSFVYRANDGTANSANTTATLTVISGPNQAPNTVADTYNATEDTTLTIPAGTGVLSNDTDGEGDTFTAELATALAPAGAGSLTLNANGSFTYTPALNFAGAATFSYRARDAQNALSAATLVTINVANVNDEPVANNDTYSTDPGITLNIPAAGVLANDTDADGNSLTAASFTALTPGAAGSLTPSADGSFSYVPAVGFTGTATFTYRANDGTANSASAATVTIRINDRPVAIADTYAATEDAPLSIGAPGVLANDTDLENDPLTAIIVTQPAAGQGTVTLNANGSFTFTPALNFTGAASFTYKANDGARDSLTPATVTINVTGVNDAPVGIADSYNTPTSTNLIITAGSGVLANDTDVENNPLVVATHTQPTNGTLALNGDGAFVYSPTVGYTGPDAFTYRASDGNVNSAITTVTIQVGVDPSVIVINEIMYHPASHNDLEEYIELHNTAASPVDLAGWKFTKGVDFVFPAVTVPAGGYLVVAANTATFNATYGSVPLIVGGWTGSLANGGQTIRLQYPNSAAADGYSTADEVNYSKEGDWGLRRAFAHGGETGWEWEVRADGFGDSLELIKPSLSNNNGQNWTKREVLAAGNQRTPGAVNTTLAGTPTFDSAPLISAVKHRPAIPTPTQPVNVTAKLADELTTGITGKVFYRTWTQNQSTPGSNFSEATMLDDGLHGDGLANDGEFGATLPIQALGIIVEFYIQATDSGARSRTWPSPTTNAGAQGANCHYQVDTEVWTARQPIYRLIATGLDEFNFQTGNWAQVSDAAINVTFISTQGEDIDVHYQSSIRVRGAGSRNNVPRNWKLEWVADDQFNGQRGGNLNVAYPYIQYLGAQLMKQINLPHEGSTPVQVRLNRTNHATNTARYGYGMYVHMQPIGEDTYVDQNFSTDPGGNVYKKVRPHQNFTLRDDGAGGPASASYITDGWSKQSNTSANNWNDLHNLHKTLNKAGGYTVTDLEPVIDIDQWCRAFAITTILNDAETNISNGTSDDFGLYFGETNTKARVLLHDYDTILDNGDTVTAEATDGIYQLTTNTGSSSLANGEVLPLFANFYTDPVINHRYKKQLRELLDTVFLPANFDAFVDTHLSDWASPIGALPSSTRDAMKAFNVTRRNFILSVINGTFTASCSLPQTNGYFTTTTANATGLGGTTDPVTTRRVTVNGTAVTVDNYNGGAAGNGTWTAGTAVTLRPGINQVTVRAHGTNDAVLSTQTFEIVYDDASVQSVASIAGNTTWTAATGPYLVTAPLTVDDETLSIEPGTTVYFGTNTKITVSGAGRLLAQATEALPIIFSKQPGAATTWNGITFNGTTTENHLTNVIFADNANTAINLQEARATLDRITFRNTAKQYLSASNSSFVVTNTTFPNATASFQPVTGSQLSGEGIFRDCTFGVPQGENAALTYSDVNRPLALQILGCTFNGSAADLVQLNGCDAWIENNVFLHAHKNSTAPTASAISGGNSGTSTSQITIYRNLFYDCDHAITMRQGNSFALIQNTIARITHTGGTDTTSAVLNFANAAETPGAGGIAEANIIWDATNLTRNYNPALTNLSLENNIIPAAWTGPGTDNVIADPLLGTAAISTPATATAAQTRSAFILNASSPATGTGTLGVDKGALIPAGTLASGHPLRPTNATSAIINLGPNGSFPGFPTYGYTHISYSVNGGAYTAEAPLGSITLTALAAGTHTLSILGKNDAGVWQTTPTNITWTVDPAATPLIINEVLATNIAAYLNGTTRPDYIELRNLSTTPVNLAGWKISDAPLSPTNLGFTFGSLSIPAGGMLVVHADTATAQPGIHTLFGLDGDGDGVYLYTPAGVLVDSVAFGSQIPDLSIGRRISDLAWTLNTPTPNATNIAAALGNATGLKINEWCAANDFIVSDDFVELYNPSAQPVALAALKLNSDLQNTADHVIAPLTYIAAGGFTRFIADSNLDAGPHHLSWSISKLRESIRLRDPSDVVIDQVTTGPQSADVSEGRLTDGGIPIGFFSLPTPGYSNGTNLTAQQLILENLRITELMYNPNGGTTAPEFVELKNTNSTQTLDLTGVIFNNGIDYAFPAGTTLAPGAFIIITSNSATFLTRYGFAASGQYTGKLADGGENVRLEIGGFQLGIHDFAYSNNWHPSANGTGASIEIINPLADRGTWDQSTSWRATAANPGLQGIFGTVAGDDQSITLPAIANLQGVVSYGSQSPAGVTLAWTKDSGPGTVTFSAPTALISTATFSLPGTYVLRLTATGTVAVFDTVQIIVSDDYTTWVARNVGSNPAQIPMLADPDGDGRNNLLEYGLGTNPLAPITTPFGTTQITGGLLTLTFQISSTANVSYIVEVSDNLITWTSDTVVATMTGDNGTQQTWYAYDSNPVSMTTKRFIRVRVLSQ